MKSSHFRRKYLAFGYPNALRLALQIGKYLSGLVYSNPANKQLHWRQKTAESIESQKDVANLEWNWVETEKDFRKFKWRIKIFNNSKRTSIKFHYKLVLCGLSIVKWNENTNCCEFRWKNNFLLPNSTHFCDIFFHCLQSKANISKNSSKKVNPLRHSIFNPRSQLFMFISFARYRARRIFVVKTFNTIELFFNLWASGDGADIFIISIFSTFFTPPKPSQPHPANSRAIWSFDK